MVAGALFAGGRTEAQPPEDEVTMEVSRINWDQVEVGSELTVAGKLAVYGNEPHTYLAVAVPDATTPSGIRLVQIEGELKDDISELQGQRIMVRGMVTRDAIGPGFPMVIDATQFELLEDS
jgi:hypothetical protein